jgi:hypothetical protein
MANLPDDLFSDDPPEDLKQLYYVIGKAIIAWSTLERILDMCVLVIHGSYGLTLPSIKEIPRSLENKTDFIKKALRDTDSDYLRSLSKSGTKIMNKINAIKDSRHNLTHGMLLNIYPKSFDIQKFNYKKSFDDVKITIKLKDCLALGNKFLDLARELASFFRQGLLRQVSP